MEISYKIYKFYTKILVKFTKAIFLLFKGEIRDLKVSFELGRYIALYKPGVLYLCSYVSSYYTYIRRINIK